MLTSEKKYHFSSSGSEALSHRPIVIGSGPAGLFCAWYLAKAGYCPLVLERGEEADKRQKTVENFWKNGILDPDSNVQFGEGGAGTFSDGKLNTLVKDTFGRGREVLSRFVEAGAPSEILYQQKPHLGTDQLVGIVQFMRHQIEEMGGEFRFRSTVTDLMIRDRKLLQSLSMQKRKYRQKSAFLLPATAPEIRLPCWKNTILTWSRNLLQWGTCGTSADHDQPGSLRGTGKRPSGCIQLQGYPYTGKRTWRLFFLYVSRRICCKCIF